MMFMKPAFLWSLGLHFYVGVNHARGQMPQRCQTSINVMCSQLVTRKQWLL